MRLSRITNTLARCFIIFILAYLWLSFYLESIVVVFVSSFLIVLGLEAVIYAVMQKRNTSKQLTREQQKHMASVILQLRFMPRIQVAALFKAALMKLEKDYRNFFPLFHKQPLVEDVISCINKAQKQRPIIILAEKFDADVVMFVKSLKTPVTLMDGKCVYEKILLPADVFPRITVELKTKQRLTWQMLRDNMFRRVKAKTYVILGILVLFTSLIVRLNLYYILIATVIFGFALVSLFAKQQRNGVF